ncbi:GLRX1 protein, partial [Turnix velox]|nr:GLRX1 protein [Turnix velox]
SMAAYVIGKVKDDRVTVFMKRGCPYSRNALEMLKKHIYLPDRLHVFDITGMEDVQDYLQDVTGERTVPRIFIGRQCIGGYTELENLSWKLPEMLRQIGAMK